MVGYGKIAWGVAITAAAALAGASYVPQHTVRDTYDVKVLGTDMVRVGTMNKPLISTRDLGTGEIVVFENTASWLECVFPAGCKLDTGTLQARIADAEKDFRPVRVETYGASFELTGRYPNIVSIKDLPQR